MDVLSHAGWGYASLRWRGKKQAWLGAFAGAAPDLLTFTPSTISRWIYQGRPFSSAQQSPTFWREPGPLPPELQSIYDHYYVFTHSLVILLGVIGLFWLFRKRDWMWLGIPYGLHIILDIPTHVRFQTPFLYPISRWTFQGASWGEPWIFWPNWILLIVTLCWLRRRYGKRAIYPTISQGRAT